MKPLLISLCLLAVVDDPHFAAIDGYVTARMRSARIPGLALAIVKDDRIVYVKGYGAADPSGRPVTPRTPFMIGSITKSLTALAVMQLVESGQVQLDAPVQRYLPWFQVADPAASGLITVRQLLTMTSGLPQRYDTQLNTAQDAGALERTVRSMRTAALSRPVGSFGYSNANFDTLGVIVQTVSGVSYEDYVKEHIFMPLDMHDSFLSREEAQRHGMASGHRWWFGIPVPVTLPYNRSELPAGYILSSAGDMSHFLVAEMNGGRYGPASVLSPAGIRLTQTVPAPGPYAMGWEVLHDGGRTLINHDGGTPNFQSSLFFDPDARSGVFIAANILNLLDAFSSPPSSSPLDGLTVRGMARTVLSLATDRPLPRRGPGHERLTLIFNLVIAVLTSAFVILLARIRIGHLRTPWRGAVVLLACCPLAVAAYLAVEVPAWKVFVQFQPDLGYWLYGVAVILFLRGLLEGRRLSHG